MLPIHVLSKAIILRGILIGSRTQYVQRMLLAYNQRLIVLDKI